MEDLTPAIKRIKDLYEISDLIASIDFVREKGMSTTGFVKYLDHFAVEDHEQLGAVQPLENYLLFYLGSEFAKCDYDVH